MNHAGRHRLSRPRHAWEDGAFSVALGWITKKDAEQTRRSALQRRARPARHRRPNIVSALVLGGIALLSVWGLSRPRLEAARSLEVSLADEVRHPIRVVVESVNANTAPVAAPSSVQNAAQPKVLERPSETRQPIAPRNVAASSATPSVTPASAQSEARQATSEAATNDGKEPGRPRDEESVSAFPRARVDNQPSDGSDIVDWLIKKLPRQR
jgi:hypothetical protein